MTDHKDDDAFLGTYFADARAAAPGPDADLVARVLADAASAHPAAAHAPTPIGLWARLAGMFNPVGGFAGASVVAASALLGITIGYGGPDAVLTLPGIGDLAGGSVYEDALELMGSTSLDISALEG